MWVYWYYWRFVEAMPRFSFSGLDMKTYAAATLKSQYKFATKRNWPSKWKTVEQVHTHVAEQDAIEQGHMFFAMQQDNTAKYDIEIQRVAGGPTMFINTRPIVVEDDDPSYDTISARKFITLMQRIGFFGESKGHRLQVSDVARLIKKLGNRVTLR